jgi:hypothetical protein
MGTVKEVVQLYNFPDSVESTPPAFPQAAEKPSAKAIGPALPDWHF